MQTQAEDKLQSTDLGELLALFTIQMVQDAVARPACSHYYSLLCGSGNESYPDNQFMGAWNCECGNIMENVINKD